MQGSRLRSASAVVIAGYFISVAASALIFMRRLSSLQQSCDSTGNPHISLADASSLPRGRSTDMHFVDLSSVDTKIKAKNKQTRGSQYTSYSNPYAAQDATSPGAIKPALIPHQVQTLHLRSGGCMQSAATKSPMSPAVRCIRMTAASCCVTSNPHPAFGRAGRLPHAPTRPATLSTCRRRPQHSGRT